MGNEMGNNNTSAIKEEDNISEAERKTFQEDTSELANGVSQDIHAGNDKEENQNIPTSIAKDVMEKASSGITNELGPDTWQEDGHSEDVKGKTQTIATDEAKDDDTHEKAIWFASNHTTSMLENDSMEGDTHAVDVNMENQMLPTAEAEDIQEKAEGVVSEDAATELGKFGLQEDSHACDKNMENQMLPTAEAEGVQAKASGVVSEDATTELGKVTLQEDSHADDVKDKMDMIPTDEARDVQEKAAGVISEDATAEIERVTLQEDSQVDGVKEKMEMVPTDEAKDVQEEASVLNPNNTASIFENDLLGEDTSKSDMNVENKMHPASEFEDVQEKATGMASDCTRISFENDLLKRDNHENDGIVDHQKHQTVEGKDDHVAARLDFDDKTSEFEDKLQEDKQDGNVVIPVDIGIDDEGTTTISVSDDPLNLTSSFEGAGDEITEVRQSEKSPNAGLVEAEDENSESLSKSSLEGTEEHEKQEESCLIEHLVVTYNHHLDNEPSIQQGDEITEVSQPEKSPNAGPVEAEDGNSENLSSSSLEGTEEYEKQEESCLREHQLVAYNHHLNNEPSIQHDEEETTVLMMNDVNMSNNIHIQESSSVHSDHDEAVNFLSEQSFLGTESVLEENLLDTNSHCQQIKDDGLEKEMESHDKLDGKDGNEFGSCLIDSSGATPDSSSIDNNTNGISLSKVNYATEDSLNSFIESFLEDNPLNLDHEENCKVLYEESILRRRGSTKENSHDYKPGQCMKDSLEEYKSGMVYTCDMARGSNGDCNGGRNILHDSDVSRLVTNDQSEEPKVTENGVPYEAYVNNSSKASEESGGASGEKHSVVSEAKRISLVPGLTVADCRHEEGENYKNKIEETNEKPEASHVMVNTYEETEMSDQCNSDLVAINKEESFPLQNNSSLLHICDCHQDNVKQTKSFTATSMPKSDWKQTNESNTFDSSKLTVPSVDLVGNKSLEEEGEECPQHTEEASSEATELTISTATKSIGPCSNNYIFANGGYETRDSVSRLSTESNPDHPNISCQIQKSPSFNLNLRKEARPQESDQTPLLQHDKSENESLSKQTGLNLMKSMPHDEYEQCMLHSEEMPVEEKIVTMERSYSKKSKAPFIALLKEEEETHLLDTPQIQDNHVGTKNAVSSTSPKRKEKRKPRSSFFSSCMCCATVP
ncbi:uncharacterized protein LOC114915942 isoform X2 [Cajanus cajan]|uniref:uncharacterized protein LOC114915942 isoform X2 n=1 Tax=Cajanus cajan TaxID=3821 RepID=UPI0010FB7994|nr:uncharacterized protein LOC114915942 isoform X2 [Cajanus cajan]